MCFYILNCMLLSMGMKSLNMRDCIKVKGKILDPTQVAAILPLFFYLPFLCLRGCNSK